MEPWTSIATALGALITLAAAVVSLITTVRTRPHPRRRQRRHHR